MDAVLFWPKLFDGLVCPQGGPAKNGRGYGYSNGNGSGRGYGYGYHNGLGGGKGCSNGDGWFEDGEGNGGSK